MTIKKKAEVGDMYRCEACEFEIHVTKACDCDDCSCRLECCNQEMTRVTSPPVQ